MARAFSELKGKYDAGRSDKVKVTILASEWGSSKGGLSILNRNLAIQLAKSSDVEISFFVPQCSEKDKREALCHNIRIVEVEKNLVAYDELDLLSYPPDDLQIEVVVGHGVKLGRQAQIIRRYRQCKWVQVVHADPEEMGMFKCYPDPISKGEEKHKNEVMLCKIADFVVGIGPKLAEAFRSYLRPLNQAIFDFTPGIIEEFLNVEQVAEEGKHRSVLVFGRGDAEDFKLKGFDIAGKAIASLVDTHLVFVGAPDGKHEEIAESFMQCGLPANCLRVRGYEKSRESLKSLFCEVDLMLMPSRTDGFGLTALEALSAGLPVLVSKNSGFGEALCKVPYGSFFVVNSDNPEVWAAIIKNIIWDKDRQSRLVEAEGIRKSYQKKYCWTKQSDALLVKIISLVRARLRIQIGVEAVTEGSAEKGMGMEVQPPELQDVVQEVTEPSTATQQQVVVNAGLATENCGNGRIQSTQAVLNRIAEKYLQDVSPSSPEEYNGFMVYLKEMRKALVLDVKSGSLIVTVEVGSEEILEELWKDYCEGHLNEMAQKFLVTEELLEEFCLIELKLTTLIAEEEYKACKRYFSENAAWSSQERSLEFMQSFGRAFSKMSKEAEEDVTRKGKELWKALKKNPLDRQTIRDLLQNGAPPNFREPGIAETKRTPLHYVVCEKHGDEELMQMLLERGARTDLVDSFCFTPLHLAAERGNLQAVKTLVKHSFCGAEIKMKNKSDETPVDMALKKKRDSVVSFFIQEDTGKVSLDVDSNTQVKMSREQGGSVSLHVTGPVHRLMVGDNNRMEYRDNQ